MADWCWINGQYIPLAEARVSVEDRGFNFADGVYELLRVYNGRPFATLAHLERLQRSCQGIDLPMNAIAADLNEVMAELIRRGGWMDGTIYIQITRGASPRNHVAPIAPTPTVVLFAKALLALPVEPGRGQSVITVEDDRWQRCWIKSISLLPNILAKTAADRCGADEAIFVDNGLAQEGSTSNLFIIKGGRLITAPGGPKVLPGVTRLILLELAKTLNIPVEDRPPSLEEALAADEVFIASTTREVAWVQRWDDQTIGSGEIGPLTRRLRDAMRNHIRSS
ncbi:MAG TPA: aminotransferase class IV [Tepidisphaeraceae bacterium]|jgi:D-alanine transaminase